MKILQLTRQFLPAEGGIEAVVEGLSCALQERGHTVHVATLRSIFATGAMAPRESVESGITVRRMRHWGTRRYPVAPEVLGEVRGYDLVHIHAIDFFLDYLSLLRLVHRIPLVVSTHGGIFHTQWAHRLKNIYFHTVTRMSLMGVSGIVCVSAHDLERFGEIVSPERIRVIENGVSIDHFKDLKKEVEPGLILGISRLAENKRVHKVLEAVAMLKKRFPEIRLEWVGADFDGLRPELERRAKELGVEGRVRFRGVIGRDELNDLLKRAHMFVTASAYESFGVATVEAMSAATAVVVTPVGVHPSVVQDGITGFVTDREATTLSAKMAQALTLPRSNLLAMGEAARAAAQRFSWTNVAPQYEQLYREIISSPARSAA